MTNLHWEEDFDESLNYWFWRRRRGYLDKMEFTGRLRLSLEESAVERHSDVGHQVDFIEYLSDWRRWQAEQFRIQTTRRLTGSALRAHYQAVAATGLTMFNVQWVMAPIGDRWLFPPHVAVLGAEGADSEQRRRAVVEAALALSALQGS